MTKANFSASLTNCTLPAPFAASRISPPFKAKGCGNGALRSLGAGQEPAVPDRTTGGKTKWQRQD